MITRGDVREFQVALNVRAMLIEHLQHFFQRQLIHLRRAQEQGKCPEQIQRAQRNFHCTIPIDAARDRILGTPASQLAKKLCAEAFVIRDGVCASQRDEVREAIQLPGHPRIRAVFANEIYLRVVIKRPIKSRQRIAIPLHAILAETTLAESEQWPAMLVYDSPGRLQQLRRLIRKYLFLEFSRAPGVLKSGKKSRFHARTKVGEQVGRADPRKFFAQASRLLV